MCFPLSWALSILITRSAPPRCAFLGPCRPLRLVLISSPLSSRPFRDPNLGPPPALGNAALFPLAPPCFSLFSPVISPELVCPCSARRCFIFLAFKSLLLEDRTYDPKLYYPFSFPAVSNLPLFFSASFGVSVPSSSAVFFAGRFARCLVSCFSFPRAILFAVLIS